MAGVEIAGVPSLADLHALDAHSLVALYRQGKLSPVDAYDAAVARMAPLEPEITRSFRAFVDWAADSGHAIQHGQLPPSVDALAAVWPDIGRAHLARLFLDRPDIRAGASPKFVAMADEGSRLSASHMLAILVPPSINLVIFAIATSGMGAAGPDGKMVGSPSIGQLFIVGVAPGVMLATLLGITTIYIAWKNDCPRMPKAGWARRFKAFRESFWGLFLVVLVMGGIYSGLFTPTEAAAMAAVYAFVIAVFVHKDLKLADIAKPLLSSAGLGAMLLYNITNAALFSYLMTSEQIPQAMAGWMLGAGLGKITFLLLVNLLLLAAGDVMEPSSIVLIMAPILFPVAVKLGVNPVRFGILMAVNMEVGMRHPPVGLNLYVASGIARMGISELTVAVTPWLLTMIGFLILVTYAPEVSLWLPRLLGMGQRSMAHDQS